MLHIHLVHKEGSAAWVAPKPQEGGRTLSRVPKQNDQTEATSPGSSFLLARLYLCSKSQRRGKGHPGGQPDPTHTHPPRRARRSAHLGQVVLLVQHRPPLLALTHEGAQTRGGEGHRGGLGAGRDLLGQPRALQAAGRARPAPGAPEWCQLRSRIWGLAGKAGGGWEGRGHLTRGARTACYGGRPQRRLTALRSSDSDGSTPCAGFSAGHGSPRCSQGTQRSACARGGQGTQVTLGWMGDTGAMESPLIDVGTQEFWSHP